MAALCTAFCDTMIKTGRTVCLQRFLKRFRILWMSVMVQMLLCMNVQAHSYLTYTFDDGNATDISAASILHKYNQVGTSAVYTNALEASEKYGLTNVMTFSDTLNLQNQYQWEIASHSISHPHLTQLPFTYNDEKIHLTWHELADISNVYFIDNPNASFGGITQDGVTLEKKWSVTNVSNNPGTFYWNRIENRIYVHTLSSDDPNAHEMGVFSAQRELAESKGKLVAEGLDVNTFVAPFHDWSPDVADLAKPYYAGSAIGPVCSPAVNPVPIEDPFGLARRPVQATHLVEDVIEDILEAGAENGWIILCFHEILPEGETRDHDRWWSEDALDGLASWVSRQDAVEVVTLSEMLVPSPVPSPAAGILLVSGLGLLVIRSRYFTK